eukprot:TRINITY_DN19581_c0_g1_i1.p1 TRINITY_DN19581_c0_g1~~TRINITY_DN19581_c0_g1_i1.p1  ORF type:complete len:591 (+),score=122.50 TRINITY_DN19581_c0_g1_i1:70-1773(+)
MASICRCFVFVLSFCSLLHISSCQAPVPSHVFLAPTGTTVNSEDIRSGIDYAIQKLVSKDSESEKRSAFIESSIASTVQALPKNSVGRLEPKSVRYVVHSYFAKVHGWRIEGLEPHSAHADLSEVHSVSVLKEKLPTLVESILEDRQSGRGLTSDHVVLMIFVLEQLLFFESLAMLPKLYFANGFSTADEIDEAGMKEILISYLMTFRQGTNAKLDSVEYHLAYKAARMKGPLADALVTFAQDTLVNYEYKHRNRMNPFEAPWYTYTHASEIIMELAHGYGKWQDGDCRSMKEHLVNMSVSGSGRVPLNVFHSQTSEGFYNFRESLEYLNSIGALDMSSKDAFQVRLVNYVLGPTNCIARNSYFSVCCISECEDVMSEIEVHVQSPRASADHIIRVVENITTSSVDAPRELRSELKTKLRAIAERHGDSVPLYGRLFAQWLHFSFPNECPYPVAVDGANLMPSKWASTSTVAAKGEVEEIKASSSSMFVDSEDQGVSEAEWSDEEVLPLRDLRDGPLASAFSLGIKFLPVLLVLRGAYTLCKAAASLHGGRYADDSSKTLTTMTAFV